MADILWDDIVGDKTVEIGGYVGDLLAVARAHVNAAVKAGELTKNDAGQIYTAMIPAAMQNGIGFAMQEELTEAKIATEEDKLLTAAANRLVLTAQEALYVRQAAGFDDNKHQKVLETALSAWGITYQDTEIPSQPTDIVTDVGIDALFSAAKADN